MKKVKDPRVSIESVHVQTWHALVAIYSAGYEVDVSFLGDHAAQILADAAAS